MKKWNRISTMTYTTEVRNLAKAEIKENLKSGLKGYWKQSIVCKIAAHHYLTMTYAWQLFNELLADVQDELTPKPTEEQQAKAWKEFINATPINYIKEIQS